MKLNFASLFTLVAALAISVLMMPALSLAAGHIAPTGVTETQASQLIFWYDQSDFNQNSPTNSRAFLQITNGSIDTGVNIHVQIFADDLDNSTDLCREHDFTDTLTPHDSVRYDIANLNLDSVCDIATGPCGNNVGAAIPILLDGTRGFIVVTAVDTVTLPRQAISHNFLFGTIDIFGDDVSVRAPTVQVRTNGMGRQAVDFATGALTAPGELLDGVTNGLRLLQPSELQFNFSTDLNGSPPNFSEITSITFTDVYSDPSGEYRASPSTVVWDPFILDEFEVGTSCQQHVNTCFVTHGVNNETTDATFPNDSDFLLCPASDVEIGWVKMAVSGLSGLANNVGVTAYVQFSGFLGSAAGASWMIAK